MKKQLNIRFLKAGSATIKVADGLTKVMLVKLAQDALDEMSDSQIIESLQDFTYDDMPARTLFDADNLQIDAIEDPEDDYNLLYQTKAWEGYQSGGLQPEINETKPPDSSVDNGGSTSYYDLPKNAKNIQDIIEAKDISWNMANILKACYRIGSQDHSSTERDLNKIIYFANRQLNIEKKRNPSKESECTP